MIIKISNTGNSNVKMYYVNLDNCEAFFVSQDKVGVFGCGEGGGSYSVNVESGDVVVADFEAAIAQGDKLFDLTKYEVRQCKP